MPRPCSVCGHPARQAIDKALVADTAFPALAALYRVSEDALGRHKANHLPATLARAQDAAEAAHADDLLGQVRNLRDKALGILKTAEDAGQLTVALAAIREARATLELLAEMEGEINRQPVINLLVMPEWLALRARIATALVPYPEARAALAEVLSAGD